MATIVKKSPGETDDRLIARFRKKVIADDILNDLREREFYKPPSLRKKERLAVLRRTRRKS